MSFLWSSITPRAFVRASSASLAWTAACLVASLVVAPTTVADESSIKTTIQADGTTLVYNETTTQRARRTAGRLMPVPDGSIERILREHARHYGLPARLVQSVMQVESGYNVRALSSKGAMGLMQLMPGTARELGVDDPWDPRQNIRGGTAYLQRMLAHFGDLEMALAAYNAGPGAVTRFGGIPPYRETQAYVRKVLDLYRRTPPESAVLSARDTARERRANEAKQREQSEAERGAPVHVNRDANGQYVFTTSPPGAS